MVTHWDTPSSLPTHCDSVARVGALYVGMVVNFLVIFAGAVSVTNLHGAIEFPQTHVKSE
jgi:hypothetical protein